ncbi:hypothetical protein [Streptomyces sp. NPDC046805]|uniref:zinc-binding dehydrogenase n=1 Tax=Streptomyces sp. NPDC046805 TaxID=3155134 RepID=UPI003409C0F2
MLETKDGRLLDVAVEFVGHSSVQWQVLDAVDRYGRVVLVGVVSADLALPSSPFLIRVSKRDVGRDGSEPRHLQQVAELVQRGRLDLSGCVSQVLPLEEFERGLDVLRNKIGGSIRVLLTQ